MKKLKLILIFILSTLSSYSQEAQIKEISPTEFKIEHTFECDSLCKESYENRLTSLFDIKSLDIEENYIYIIFKIGENRSYIEDKLLIYSKSFGYSIINIKQ